MILEAKWVAFDAGIEAVGRMKTEFLNGEIIDDNWELFVILIVEWIIVWKYLFSKFWRLFDIDSKIRVGTTGES